MSIPKLEAVKALDDKFFGMLTEEELATLNFYVQQGRRFGVSVSMINEADPGELAQVQSQEQADHILKSANSRITVSVANI